MTLARTHRQDAQTAGVLTDQQARSQEKGSVTKNNRTTTPCIIGREGEAQELYGITLYDTKRATLESYLVMATSSEAARRAALEDNATRTHRPVGEVEQACESETVFLTENGVMDWTIVNLVQWTFTSTSTTAQAGSSEEPTERTHLPDKAQKAIPCPDRPE